MPEISVRQAKIEIRTVPLTKVLLKQFRKMTRLPIGWMTDNGSFKDEILQGNVIGWIHASVLSDDNYERFIIVHNEGDWYLFGTFSGMDRSIMKGVKQLYI